MRLLVLCAIAAMTMQSPSSKEIITAGPAPSAPYSPAIKAGGFIYVAGTLAQDASGAIVGKGDVALQTRRILERMRQVLEAAGSSLDQVVSVSVYLRTASDFQTMNGAYRPFWPADPPTRTTVVTDLVFPDALVEMSMIAVPKGTERRVIHPDGWQTSPNPYSYGIKTGDTLFLSGLVARNLKDNSGITGDVGVQTRAIMENASVLLGAAGMTFANVVSSKVFITDTAHFQGMNEAYRGYFTSGFPARATAKSGLAGPGPVVEITFTASSSPRQVIGTPPPGIPISPGIKAGQRLYLSGMLGNTPQTAGSVEAQTKETLARIRATLEQASATPADVVDATVYLTDVTTFATMNAAYRPFFGSGFPARTTIGTPLVVNDGLVEIMVTAVVR